LIVVKNRREVSFVALLTLILLLAAATRILHITAQSLWIDEGITYFNISQPDLLDTLIRTDVHPPLYFMLLEGWIALAGGSVLSMRMFSALFGVLGVALIVPLAREFARPHRWFQHPSVPILSALMLTLSDPDVVLAQDVRMYTLRTVLILISMIFYLRWTRYQTSVRAQYIAPPQALIWVLASVAMMYTQYQSACADRAGLTRAAVPARCRARQGGRLAGAGRRVLRALGVRRGADAAQQ
jgi:uncharacterized membrane protein